MAEELGVRDSDEELFANAPYRPITNQNPAAGNPIIFGLALLSPANLQDRISKSTNTWTLEAGNYLLVASHAGSFVSAHGPTVIQWRDTTSNVYVGVPSFNSAFGLSTSDRDWETTNK